jgi:hypothetical protein
MATAVAVPADTSSTADSKLSSAPLSPSTSLGGAGVSTAVVPASAAVAQSPPKPKPHTVTPGPIVHLYKENDGTCKFNFPPGNCSRKCQVVCCCSYLPW